MNTADLLIELGTEELPPTALKKLSQSFSSSILKNFSDASLSYQGSHSFATPRRLAIVVESLQLQQDDIAVEKFGPAVAAAYDSDGVASKAAEGFARSNGVSLDELEVVNTDKGERLCYRSVEPGKSTPELLEAIIISALEQLPIPKRMRWGASRAEFVRPVHWLTVVLGAQAVKCTVLGIQSSNVSYGHRFHAPGQIQIANAKDYESLLREQGQVQACFEKRRENIASQVKALASSIGGNAVIEDDLLDEVTALVEKPVALCGNFDEEFLAVPQEALIYSMSEHQKYFHVTDDTGALMPAFITVSNIESKTPDKIVSGNERVIRPRLADAAFFFETDKKCSLQAMRERLRSIVFQKDLGTVFDKTERIASLAATIADMIDGDPALATTAGQLCKADLTSDMVLEFDKMQGTAGYYYAVNEGCDAQVSEALKAHYLPKHAGDQVPQSPVSSAVALADRLDSLTGIFGIGQEPSGSKDPFALRRAAIAILQIVLRNRYTLDISALANIAANQHASLVDSAASATRVVEYLFDRFGALYQDQGVATEVFQAVRAIPNVDLLDFDARVQAVAEFVTTPEAGSLASSNKRVGNILQKSSADDLPAFNGQLLQDPAETALANAIEEKEQVCKPLFTAGDYSQGLAALTELKPVVDTFFDEVMVNVDEPALKNNRLALLAKLRNLFLEVADISILAPAKQ